MIVNSQLKISLKELEFTYVRSSGPGGQKVNKTSSCAVLRWNVLASKSLTKVLKERLVSKWKHRLTEDGDLIIRSERFRDRSKNVADCLSKLQKMLLRASALPKKRIPTKPSKASREKNRETKKKQAEKKRLREKVKY